MKQKSSKQRLWIAAGGGIIVLVAVIGLLVMRGAAVGNLSSNGVEGLAPNDGVSQESVLQDAASQDGEQQSAEQRGASGASDDQTGITEAQPPAENEEAQTAADEADMDTSLVGVAPEPNNNASRTSAPATAAVGGGVAALPTQAAQPPVPISAEAPQSVVSPVATPSDMFFQPISENPFIDTQDDNLSTFAMDVDTASYTVGRNYIMNYSQLPPADSVRTEEYVNYFDADYPSPTGDNAFAIDLTAAPAPFGYDGHYLFRVGIQGRYIAPQDRTPMLLIFVIDVSGSMDMENRLGLVKESLAILLNELREDDRVGIAVYSDNSRVILEPTPASEREIIQNAIDNLRPEGSTNAEAGLRLGYNMATAHRYEGQPTRVILLSDGVANVGLVDPSGILGTIQSAVDQDVTLSTIGFGMANYNDVLMEQLANDGNGNYYYVDNLREARRVFSFNLTGTLQVIAYDAKIQVEFNPAVTDRYRLLGYENRAVADSDFRVDTVDAGEVGAGHSVTALYEIALEETPGGAQTVSNEVIATVYVRYEDATTREVVEISRQIRVGDLIGDFNDAPPSFRLQAGVAEFSEILRGSYWAEGSSFTDVLQIIRPLQADFAGDPTVVEFVGLVERAAALSGE